MKVIIAGGSGFIGQELENYLLSQGHEVKVLTRNPKKQNDVLWDGETLGYWASELDFTDVLINMAGKSVDCRYYQRNKDLILSSRINSTRVLQKAIDSVKNPPKLWINSSTATIYKHSLTVANDEENGILGSGFSVNVAKAWEKEFFNIDSKKTRKVALRTAIVLGKLGGALQPFIGLTKIGAGGKQGSGEQKVSWIHIQDLCKIIDFVINNKSINGVINASAPYPISNNIFMQELRRALGVKIGLPTPLIFVKLGTWVMRTEAELVLKSRFVVPRKLKEAGYEFEYPTIDACLKNIINN